MRTELVVGLADTRYAVERPWGDLPSGLTVSGVSDVAVDSRDHVYLYAGCWSQRDAAPDEAFQRGVRDVHAALAQQLLDACQLQVLILQPRRDLLAIRLQPVRLG